MACSNLMNTCMFIKIKSIYVPYVCVYRKNIFNMNMYLNRYLSYIYIMMYMCPNTYLQIKYNTCDIDSLCI